MPTTAPLPSPATSRPMPAAATGGSGSATDPARSRTLILVVWLATLILGASTWCATWVLSERDQHDAMQRAQRDTANLARIIAEQTTRAISSADRVLHVVGYDLQHRHSEDTLLRDLMGSASLESDLLLQLAHADRNGDLVQTSVEGAPAKVNLSDREHFRVHKDGTHKGLFISRPVFGRASGKWSIQLSRRVDAPDGTFDGIIVASLDPFYFSRIFDDLDVGEHGVIVIFGRDGILRARNILTNEMLSRDLPPSSGLQKAVQEAPEGFLRTTSPIDGVTRLMSYRTLTAYPLVVAAGFAETDFMAETWTRQRAYVLGATGASVLLLVLASLVTWHSLVQERIKRALDEAIRQSRANKQKLKDIAETASDWFWEMDTDFRFTSVSGPIDGQEADEAAFLGRRRDEIALREPGDEAFWREHRRCLEEHRPFRNFEFTCLEPAGGTRVWSVSGKPVFDEAGTFRGYRGSGADITKRHRAERSLAASEHRYRAMFEAVGQPIVTTDQDGSIIGFNPSAERLFGHREEEVTGWSIALLMPEPDRSIPLDLLKRCRAAGHASPVMEQRELTIRRKDGATVPVEIALSGWRSDGRDCFIGILRDLTQTKQIEDSLRQARDSAEHANRMKSQFLATISHEIRTPMHGVLGTLALLGDGDLAPEHRHLATVARRSAETLLRLLDDILDFSKLEAGRITIEEADCDPAQVLETVLELFEPGARDKGIALSVELAPSVPDAVMTDAARLRQILCNLVGNALKFTEAGHVVMRVRRGGDLEGGRFRLEFEVEDTGIGLHPEAAATLFDRFTQADSSITRRYGGTGLGLAICKELCAAMGGGIGVRSAPGQGSLFTFSITCLASTPQERTDRERAAQAAAPPPALPPLRVLAVDDNPVNRDIVRRLLQRGGHSVLIASDGREAVRMAEETDIDLVLMDVQMPGMDGLEATRRIRGLENRNSRIPIIALTAQASRSSQSECLAAGMNGFVTKPVRPNVLWREMAAALCGREAEAEALPAAPPGPESLIDREQSESIAGVLGPEGWREAIDGLAASARKQIVTLHRALDGGEVEHRRVAHSLKGMAWNVGAKRLGAVAAEIEKAACLEEARPLVAGLEDLLARTLDALEGTAPVTG
ncbi:PAS domain S-box protein [Azospirillum agricola]|uniref:PAS domain S-box protein n=1 Tax=Azospirillum agricola TaxID=1720247 RepID=UPI000A0F2B25|nr:PAS domain S-box protein [Azospirillum agricola]SMH47917.1 PAS domain S-box-containing protein [Azospirillum lipoferum]